MIQSIDDCITIMDQSIQEGKKKEEPLTAPPLINIFLERNKKLNSLPQLGPSHHPDE